MKIYCDTNIYLDYLLKRSNLANKPISHPAYRIFSRIVKCEFELIVSDVVLKELYSNIELENARLLFAFLKRKIIAVKTAPEDVLAAKELESHFNDSLHAVLAKKHGAKCVVTRNTRHFQEILFIQAKLPEEL